MTILDESITIYQGYEKKNVFYRSDGTGWNIFHDCIIALGDDENGCT